MPSTPHETPRSGPAQARDAADPARALISHLKAKDAPAVVHTVSFARNRFTGIHKAECTCGWFAVHLALADVQARAAVHDIDGEWEAVA